ncbi:molybdate ABC transporter substrate-binding protein [Lentibacillus amyloliquefaciens]|uniref:Molybdenum ABC transporter substrate-binding protein n=1 Tax=Lentibacillus amyloliquefaciens TaxID=1472767 RepID=A0A0U4FLL0_9BACI|nr:molybdate ABC transporter substrate-binding protein [Lentibacillus amyloliquefaciens]ALX49550.1 molybdenum ABC transporter substrate-binding protein [Lentibacillus amyloliquefaciens]
MRNLMSGFLIVCLLFAAGCSGQEGSNNKEILVAAASSLSDTLSELKREFESENPDITLTLNYGSSGKLAQQIKSGAPVDLFLSADQYWMDELEEANRIVSDSRTDFIQNRLAVISTQGTSYSVNTLSDLTTLNTEQITLGDPATVPAGKYAEQALRESGIMGDLKDKFVYTANAQQTLTYVESGNTEIGIVYGSDLERSELVNELLAIDDSLHDPIHYPAAVIESSQVKDESNKFIQFLQSDRAQAILESHGFSS